MVYLVKAYCRRKGYLMRFRVFVAAFQRRLVVASLLILCAPFVLAVAGCQSAPDAASSSAESATPKKPLYEVGNRRKSQE